MLGHILYLGRMKQIKQLWKEHLAQEQLTAYGRIQTFNLMLIKHTSYC